MQEVGTQAMCIYIMYIGYIHTLSGSFSERKIGRKRTAVT
jgi:hypothetical protein